MDSRGVSLQIIQFAIGGIEAEGESEVDDLRWKSGLQVFRSFAKLTIRFALGYAIIKDDRWFGNHLCKGEEL